MYLFYVNPCDEDEKLTSKSKVDLACLPPCHSALRPPVQLVNLYKGADEPILKKPKPCDDRSCSPILPDSRAAPGHWEEEEEEEEEDEDKFDSSHPLTLILSVKAIVNDVLTIITLKPMRG